MKYMGSKNRIAKFVLPIMIKEANEKDMSTVLQSREELIQGKSYILKQRYTNYPTIRKGTVLEKTKLTIVVKFEDSDHSVRYETSTFINKWEVIEELENNVSEIYRRLKAEK